MSDYEEDSFFVSGSISAARIVDGAIMNFELPSSGYLQAAIDEMPDTMYLMITKTTVEVINGATGHGKILTWDEINLARTNLISMTMEKLK